MARRTATRLKTKSRHAKSKKRRAKNKPKQSNSAAALKAVLGVLALIIMGSALVVMLLPDPRIKTTSPSPDQKSTIATIALEHENAGPRTPVDRKATTDLLPKIAIVIDDVGHDWKSVRRVSELPAAVNLAFLPYAQDVRRKVSFAKDYGHEILVHLPMAPKSNSYDPGPMVLEPNLSRGELLQRIEWNLAQFDGYVGINNHMGSMFTEDRAAMLSLFKSLKSRNLLFLDSRTTARSSGPLLAHQLDLSLVERDVFLDNAREATAVEQQLKLAEEKSRRNGTAIAIGHPHNVTVKTIKSWAETLSKKGIMLVPLSQIAKERKSPLWRLALDENRQGLGAGAP